MKINFINQAIQINKPKNKSITTTNNSFSTINFCANKIKKDTFVSSISNNPSHISRSEIRELYNKIFEQQKDVLSRNYGGIEIIKPKITFCDKGIVTEYSYTTNQIKIPKFFTYSDFVIGSKPNIVWKGTEDGFDVFFSYMVCQDKDETQMTLKENPNTRIATKEEKMAIIASCLFHELEHSAQIQCSLCSNGAVDKFNKMIQEDSALSDEDMELEEVKSQLREFYPFIYSYRPKTKIDENSRLKALEESEISFEEFSQDFLVPTATKSDVQSYYSNTNEILALKSEVNFWENEARKMFPNLSEEFINNQEMSPDYNSLNGLLHRKTTCKKNNS